MGDQGVVGVLVYPDELGHSVSGHGRDCSLEHVGQRPQGTTSPLGLGLDQNDVGCWIVNVPWMGAACLLERLETQTAKCLGSNRQDWRRLRV